MFIDKTPEDNLRFIRVNPCLDVFQDEAAKFANNVSDTI